MAAPPNYKVRITRRALLPSGSFGPDVIVLDMELLLNFETGEFVTLDFDGYMLDVRGVEPPGQIEYKLTKLGHVLQDNNSIVYGGAHLSYPGGVIRELTFTAVVSEAVKYIIAIIRIIV